MNAPALSFRSLNAGTPEYRHGIIRRWSPIRVPTTGGVFKPELVDRQSVDNHTATLCPQANLKNRSRRRLRSHRVCQSEFVGDSIGGKICEGIL